MNVMGMNYYLRLKEGAACPCCGHKEEDEILHIGKSSAGWCFLLHVIPDEGVHDLEDWIPRFEGGTIVDEEGHELTPAAMLARIRNRSTDINWDNPWWSSGFWKYASEQDFHNRNHSERGPNNLLRHRIDGQFIIKHGEGTWDCAVGEFS